MAAEKYLGSDCDVLTRKRLPNVSMLSGTIVTTPVGSDYCAFIGDNEASCKKEMSKAFSLGTKLSEQQDGLVVQKNTHIASHKNSVLIINYFRCSYEHDFE